MPLANLIRNYTLLKFTNDAIDDSPFRKVIKLAIHSDLEL